MDAAVKLDELVRLAEALGIAVRPVPSSGASANSGGALVRLKGKEIVFLDPSASLEDQIGVLAGALSGRKALENMFVRPEIRQLIEGASSPLT